MASNRVLLVEDDPDVAETLSGLLKAFKYEVRVERDGARAMQALRTGYDPGVILLDLMMPNMDGYRFRAMQLEDQALSQIPTVVLTADIRATPARLGDVLCIHKPFDPAELLGVLEARLHGSAAQGSAKQ